MTSLAKLTDTLLHAATRAGAETADAIAIKGHSVAVEVRDRALEHAESAESVEIGLRVLLGQRQATVASSDTGAEAIAEMAERAVDMARVAPEDAHVGLADPDQLARNWDLDTLDLVDGSDLPAPAELERTALKAEAAALSHQGISQVDVAAASFARSAFHLAATNGFSGGWEHTSHTTDCVAITGEGLEMERDYCSENRIHRSDLPEADDIGHRAAERALARAGARKPETGAFPVLYDERIAGSLIGHLLQAANGSAVARGSSWLRDRLGQKVLPDGLSITENPHRPRVSGSRPFDAEGLPTRTRKIIEHGILNGWTLDLATARKLGMESTASASRGTASPPTPSVTNIALTEGCVSRDDLIRDMGNGLMVTSLMGTSINPTTGDYSRGASGFWIENGEIAYPVNECTIAGNLNDMFRTIRPANDARRHLRRVVPSLLVEGLTVAGK